MNREEIAELESKIAKLKLCGIELAFMSEKHTEKGIITILKLKEGVKKLVIPEGVLEIRVSNRSYLGDTGIEELEKACLPDSLIKIGNNVFSECSKSKRINMPSDLEEIGCKAFDYTESLREIDLSNTKIKKLGRNCFLGSGIKTIKFPKTLRNLGESSVEGEIEELDLRGTQVRKINGHAVACCEELNTIILSENTKIFNVDGIDYCGLEGHPNLTKIIVTGKQLKFDSEMWDRWAEEKEEFKPVTGYEIIYSSMSKKDRIKQLLEGITIIREGQHGY